MLGSNTIGIYSGNGPAVSLITKGGCSLGGASRVAVELYRAWTARRGKAALFCYMTTPEVAGAVTIEPSRFARMLRHLDWRLERFGLIRQIPWEIPSLQEGGAFRCGVLHFHDVFECMSPRLLERVSRRLPTFLTVHDCSPFTGGCLYPSECRRFVAECGDCPQKARIGRQDFTTHNIKLRRRVAASANVHFIFPSRWIQAEAEKSLSIAGRSHVIPNGFDPVPYVFPVRHEARRRLGFLPHERVVLMGSHSLMNPYKGTSFALEALRAVADLDPVALVLGNPSSEVQKVLAGMRVISPGFVVEKTALANYYAAADFLLFPSLADNLPIMIQESMAAETPVLAFHTGGIPEMIQHGETGWLVERGNQEALNTAVRKVLVEGVPAGMGAAAKDAVRKHYSMTEFVGRHLDLYRSIQKSRS
jgi:glycosyltransferase involved in cell wall biosynthesis